MISPAAAAARPAAPPAIGGPSGIRIRMYRVGFGDFFLLSLRDDGGQPHHVLIDCGVHAANLNSIGAAIDQLAQDTDKTLALIIMTHRHADHISGFATGKDVFAQFHVERVWMPWFEDPGNAKAVAFQAGIAAMAQTLGNHLAARGSPGDGQLARMLENITGAPGANGGPSGNDLALKVLHSGFASGKVDVKYYKAGDAADLPPSLAAIGVAAEILGPPTDANLIKEMDGKTHQYLQALDMPEADAARPFAPVFDCGSDAYPPDAFRPFDAATLEKRVGDAQPDLLAARAQQADNTINNQSLVVLFKFAGKTLLFAGDAQWGNWQHFLFGGEFGTPGHMTITDSAKTVLGSLDFYKVGHHGSTNATPIDALQAMRQGCVAMCSTEEGAYGSEKNNSEVPRKPLMVALDEKTDQQLARSDQVAVPEGKVISKALSPVFTTPGTAYIDYDL